jgi:hypothetical protein
VYKGTIYTAGFDAGGNACYWTGTNETKLSGGSYVGGENIMADSIFVYNGTVYTSGKDNSTDACYWTGTNEIKLSSGSNGFAFSIFVTQ